MTKKKQQLGMSTGTASYRLVKDLLWNFILETGKNKCYHCGKKMARDNFSIEHIKPWLDSDNPLGLFFDLKNISYSHKSCNSSAARRPTKSVCNVGHGTAGRYRFGCRCEECSEWNRKRVYKTRPLRENKR